METDPFEDALSDLRIAGTVLLHEAYAPPWAIDVPDQAALRAMLGVSGGRIMPFHLVRRGAFRLRFDDATLVEVAAPEVAVCVGGAPHRMQAGRARGAVDLAAILSGRGPPPAGMDADGAVTLLCGVFVLRASPLNPLMDALPTVVKTPTRGDGIDPLFGAAADLLSSAMQRGRRGAFTTARLVEIFCAEAIRAYARDAGDAAGWLAGLADPRIARALALIHAEPGANWSVERLADHAALSPSRFAARFRETTGESVLAYVARWRMSVACRMLEDKDRPIAEIAAKVGYDSTPAFARAFRKLVGAPPGEWSTQAANV